MTVKEWELISHAREIVKNCKSMKYDEIDEEYFAGLFLGVIFSILIGAAFLGVILLANWLYIFCE